MRRGTPSTTTRTLLAATAALLAGLILGHLGADDDVRALEATVAVTDARRWACEAALASEHAEALEQATGQCQLAAAACAQVAEASVNVERVARSLLWLRQGPEVRR